MNHALANHVFEGVSVINSKQVARERTALVASGHKRSRPNPLVSVVWFSQVVTCRHLVGNARLGLIKVPVQKVCDVLQATFKIGVIGGDVKVKQGKMIARTIDWDLGDVNFEKFSSNQVLFESHLGFD